MVGKARHRKSLIDRISLLSDTEHNEIFKLLREHNIPFTQNRNGVFLNFKNVPDDIVEVIDQFVTFCYANKKDLDEYDKRLIECKLNNNVMLIQNNNLPSTVSTHLDEVLQELSDIKHDQKWIESIKESKDLQKLETMIDLLEGSLQKVHKKKNCNMRYANAKKKFARRVIAQDKKSDGDVFSVLTLDEYRI